MEVPLYKHCSIKIFVCIISTYRQYLVYMERFLIENEMNGIITHIRATYTFIGPLSLAKLINFGTDTITEVGGALIALYGASACSCLQIPCLL